MTSGHPRSRGRLRRNGSWLFFLLTVEPHKQTADPIRASLAFNFGGKGIENRRGTLSVVRNEPWKRKVTWRGTFNEHCVREGGS